ncbi:hypothetical protein WMF45_34790 [Sorangium sp. So ce448]|uniref:hypothetical protein n=1 Tax=Sorangium sp. So ce448 TaxID=3133314 RepID=UPI003F60FBA8
MRSCVARAPAASGVPSSSTTGASAVVPCRRTTRSSPRTGADALISTHPAGQRA